MRNKKMKEAIKTTIEDKRVYTYKKMREDFEELLIYQLKINDYLGLSNDIRDNEGYCSRCSCV